MNFGGWDEFTVDNGQFRFPHGMLSSTIASLITRFNFSVITSNSVMDGRSFIAPPKNAFGFYTVYRTGRQSLAITIVHSILFYRSNFVSYTLRRLRTKPISPHVILI